MATATAAESVPVEALQESTAEDNAVIEAITKTYGDRLENAPSDTVIRFVRGYAHEEKRQESTIERLGKFLELAEKYEMRTCLDQPWAEQEECVTAWPCFLYGRDKQGHPVMYDQVGTVDAKSLVACFKDNEEKVQRFRFRFHARCAKVKAEASAESGHLIYKHILVMDLSNFGMGSLAGEFRGMLQEVLGQEQNLFPESLYKCVLVNTPWSFRMGWKIISAFIDPLTYEKIKVCSGSYKTEMEKLIDKEQIPEMYGGSGKWPVVMGEDAKTAYEAAQKKTDTAAAADSTAGESGEGAESGETAETAETTETAAEE